MFHVSCDHVSAECCTGNLSDAEVDLLNSCFDNSSVTITETEDLRCIIYVTMSHIQKMYDYGSNCG